MRKRDDRKKKQEVKKLAEQAVADAKAEHERKTGELDSQRLSLSEKGLSSAHIVDPKKPVKKHIIARVYIENGLPPPK